jgi:hypothetical protein
MKLVKIQVSGETWTRVNAAKKPGESFDQALTRLLDAASVSKQNTAQETEKP